GEGIESDFTNKKEVLLDVNSTINTPVVVNDSIIEIYSLTGNCIYKGLAHDKPQLKSGVYVVRRRDKSEKVYFKE
ncbi:MAG: hypothetical protein IIV19_02420, partial [Bacteroidaceae bacterium]|nr:hypothetical protein [Bacteroidaceae bacterium]